ncbi:MAG: MFS transporter [Deltaproteobacteria bacterium]|nr:MFS transporter [Deltaproteobacteria bacterium]
MENSLKIILFLGLVSLFSDITYEGGRSVFGPYLFLLGASAATVGFISGLGELIGFAFRFLSGYLADRTGKHWAFVFVGYFINLFSVPLVGFMQKWESVSFLILMERFGKALRTPARDAIIAQSLKPEKRGFGFGLHEALDQIGAFSGPLIMAFLVYFFGSYQKGLLFLFFPALLAITFLFLARRSSTDGRIAKEDTKLHLSFRPKREFLLYVSGMCLFGAGFCDFSLISFHLRKSGFPDSYIPVLYAFAMAIDGVSAPFFGKLYDRLGLKVIFPPLFFSSLSPVFVFTGELSSVIAGMFFWGIGMAVHESIARAHVANLAPPNSKGRVFGIFNGAFGLSWFLGSSLLGIVYEISISWVVIFSCGIQLFSILFISLAMDKKTQ